MKKSELKALIKALESRHAVSDTFEWNGKSIYVSKELDSCDFEIIGEVFSKECNDTYEERITFKSIIFLKWFLGVGDGNID